MHETNQCWQLDAIKLIKQTMSYNKNFKGSTYYLSLTTAKPIVSSNIVIVKMTYLFSPFYGRRKAVHLLMSSFCQK